ncbi:MULTISPECIES: thioredoxin family protein [unclassified Anabaena]|uniref:thioredoxin family protein n=1 Tax=unclassified Anabaena TaxID=2619674 RepID=UPI001446FB77|nr:MULTISPECIES: thioredoxin family protein [unclassified Anabaena]MTJ07642.1 thioredoxin family protein [Anabaena sp. UHCC 0204]MTJ51390.1 thioredoxin family protein [Anabaena sp. UHCC 0253]
MNILETSDTPIGSYAPDFELPGIDKQVHHLSRYLEKFHLICVISLNNDCPYVEMYIDRLKNIQAEFADSGFTLIGLNGCSGENEMGDHFEQMKAFAERHQLNFPYIWDSTQDVTRSFGVMTTPTAFLIDHHGIVRYKGQIDDHPDQASAAGVDYLRNAIACLFQEQEIQPAQTEQIGTVFRWRTT